MKQRTLVPVASAALLLPLDALGCAQAPKPAPGTASATPRPAAAFDMTGYWVSEVTEKWRFRMIVPDKGDYTQVPLNPAGRRIANAWDPAKDEAAGEACRSYGAAALLQVPGRLHITWQDDTTIRLDTDSGYADAPVPFRRRRHRRTVPRRGRDIRSPCGAAPNRGTAATDREDPQPTMRAISSRACGANPTISR